MEKIDDTLIAALQKGQVYDHPVQSIRLIETHISWVLLTGSYAYKIKKPVNFGFVDFSSLDKRRFYCHEEMRLNRRFAPELYLGIIPLTGSLEQPALGGKGTAIEYAIKMRQFPEENLLDRMAVQGRLEAFHIDELAETIARFHQRIARATADDPYGRPETIQAIVEQNFEKIPRKPQSPERLNRLDSLLSWSRATYQTHKDTLQARKANGFIRECHGDLHLGNIVLWKGHPTPFDCIEFNESFRWIDVISEIAFLIMDLETKNLPSFAYRLLNRYLEITGDYRGLELLNYYLAYRAMVRAKIAWLSLEQTDERKTCAVLEKRFQDYLDHALSFTRTKKPFLIITHGFSGSGKSFYAAQLAEHLPAIRLRSDVERKRMAGFQADARTGAGLLKGIYSQELTDGTYRRLLDMAGILLQASHSVIVDATFLERRYRKALRQLAERWGAPFLILDFQAPIDRLRQRIFKRLGESRDPSEADLEVLDYQLQHHDPLDQSEHAAALPIDTGQAHEIKRLKQRIFDHVGKAENSGC